MQKKKKWLTQKKKKLAKKKLEKKQNLFHLIASTRMWQDAPAQANRWPFAEKSKEYTPLCPIS